MSWFQVGIGGWIYQIVPSAFGPYIGHHHGLLAGVKSVFKSFERFFFFCFYSIKNYTNAELDKTELLVNLKIRTLSTEIEYYQEIWNIWKKIWRHFKTLSLFLRLIQLILGFVVFICWASRICSRSLFISCAIAVVFSKFGFGNRMGFKL